MYTHIFKDNSIVKMVLYSFTGIQTTTMYTSPCYFSYAIVVYVIYVTSKKETACKKQKSKNTNGVFSSMKLALPNRIFMHSKAFTSFLYPHFLDLFENAFTLCRNILDL